MGIQEVIYSKWYSHSGLNSTKNVNCLWHACVKNFWENGQVSTLLKKEKDEGRNVCNWEFEKQILRLLDKETENLKNQICYQNARGSVWVPCSPHRGPIS